MKKDVEIDNKKNVNKVVEIMTEANDSFDKCNYKDALDKYEEVLSLEPDNVKAIFRVGLTKTLMSNNLNNIDSLREGIIKSIEKLRSKDNNCSSIINGLIMEANKYLMSLVFKDERFFSNFAVRYYGLNNFYINLRKSIDLMLLFENNLVNANKSDFLALYNNVIYLCGSLLKDRLYSDDYGYRYTYMIIDKDRYNYLISVYRNKYSNLYYSNYV